MERSVTDITLDLQRSFAPGEITVRRGDTHRTLRFFLADGGKPYKPTDVRAVLTAQKPDGTHIFNECTVAEDRVLYDLTSQTTACLGQVECQLRLYGAENALLHTAAFTLTVEDTVYTEGDESIESTDEATTLTKLMTEAGEKLTRLDAILAEKSKQYELIDEVTLEEAVSSFSRNTDTNGVPYDFSAIRIRTLAPAAERTAQIIFSVRSKGGSSMIYHQQVDGLSTSVRATNFVARNDHGLVDYHCVSSSKDSTDNLKFRDGYLFGAWKNVVSFGLATYPASVLIPAGTLVQIYAVRG